MQGSRIMSVKAIELGVAKTLRLSCLLLCAACLLGSVPALAATTTAAPVTAKAVAAARPDVNINKAGADELAEALVGVGPSKAHAIIAWRKTHGSFKSLEDVGKVKGIGAVTLANNKAHIRF